MNKGELIANIAQAGQMTRAEAGKALERVIAKMTEAMKNGEKVTLTGFGSFRVLNRASQKGRNPHTGQELVIPERKIVKFRPAKKLTGKVQ